MSPESVRNCQINARMKVQNVVEDFNSLECQSEAPCKKFMSGVKVPTSEGIGGHR